MCFSACHWANIPKIVCGARREDSEKFVTGSLTIPDYMPKTLENSSIKIVADILREENNEVFKLWLTRNLQQ